MVSIINVSPPVSRHGDKEIEGFRIRGEGMRRRDPPMRARMQSFPGIASLWLHFRLSNDLARSVAGWSDLPLR
jgi:hypothetical protein